MTPGFQKVAPKDRGSVPQRSKTAEERVVAADQFLMDRYLLIGLPILKPEWLAHIPSGALNGV